MNNKTELENFVTKAGNELGLDLVLEYSGPKDFAVLVAYAKEYSLKADKEVPTNYQYLGHFASARELVTALNIACNVSFYQKTAAETKRVKGEY